MSDKETIFFSITVKHNVCQTNRKNNFHNISEIALLLDTHVRCVSSVMMQSSPESESCYSTQNSRIKMEFLAFYRYVDIVTKNNFNVFIQVFVT